MTIGEVYRQGKSALVAVGNEAAAFDADCLFQKAFGLSRQERILRAPEPAEVERAARYRAFAAERAGGRPLQYILGTWPFLGLELRVGEGVLIPREETELLVRTAAERTGGLPGPRAVDLCAGTGAVALGYALLRPDARVTAVEWYGEAFSYLLENIRESGRNPVEAQRLDVLDPASAERFSGLDAVLSNPPYVRAGEIPALQPEVRREPHTALDGGADGLVFYRAIARHWIPRLRPGGVAAVEIGEEQARAVSALFASAGLVRLRVDRDFNGLERVVSGIRGEL